MEIYSTCRKQFLGPKHQIEKVFFFSPLIEIAFLKVKFSHQESCFYPSVETVIALAIHSRLAWGLQKVHLSPIVGGPGTL